jgi:hypothetical protein
VIFNRNEKFRENIFSEKNYGTISIISKKKFSRKIQKSEIFENLPNRKFREI